MPVLRHYNPGAIVYMEGDKSEYIYVLKSGKVSLMYKDFDTLAEVVDHVQEGQFFGVQAVLGNYKREEVCKAQSDVELLLLTRKDFSKLTTGNYKLVLDMLKVLSTELRKIGKKASQLVVTNASSDGENMEELSIEEKLYTLGEYYLSQKNYPYAQYVLNKYIILYPEGKSHNKAQEQLDYAKSQLSE